MCIRDRSSRPREGDLVFFPLGQRLFEIKFVEHEEPFYQLGSNYVYKLKCELFEYEDEVIDTSIDAIDTQVFNDSFLKRYLTSLMKRQWGQNLIKFKGVKLPGGIELNGREIYDDALRELQMIKEEMSSTYELPPLDFIG